MAISRSFSRFWVLFTSACAPQPQCDFRVRLPAGRTNNEWLGKPRRTRTTEEGDRYRDGRTGPPLSLLPFLTEFDVAITLDSGV